MNQIAAVLLSVPAPVAYLLIAVLVFSEAALFVGFVLPGETAVFLGGVLAATGVISLAALFAITIVAAILGDTAGYLLVLQSRLWGMSASLIVMLFRGLLMSTSPA